MPVTKIKDITLQQDTWIWFFV